MRGLMMDYQLTVPAMVRRAEALAGHVEVVDRAADGTIHRYRYADMIGRAKRLAVGLQRLGVTAGDRVGTLCANNHQHLEAYFGVPSVGAVLHTLNHRLSAEDLAYIVGHAGDRVVIVDWALLPLLQQVLDRVEVERVIVAGHDDVPAPYLSYERLIADADESAFVYAEPGEHDAASMCYSSGTTGLPKAALYSHRALALLSMHWMAADTAAVSRRDVILAVVPMCHINGWGLPFAAAQVGAKLVMPGAALGPDDLLALVASERVTMSAGVPTVWFNVLHALEREPHRYDIASLNRLALGGSAVPDGLIEAYHGRHGVNVIQLWGMTETTSLATAWSRHVHDGAGNGALHATQGLPLPFVEIRARGEDGGLVPWDGKTHGELEVRGATVASAYYKPEDGVEATTPDNWLRTGDIVTIDPSGAMQIRDRAKDLIKSGGEWISSVALENSLMGHPAVAEAAVIAVPDERWHERPLAVVVLKRGADATPAQLRQHLAAKFVKWWLPDQFEFVSEIPRTATGKFQKAALRRRYRDQQDASERQGSPAHAES